MTSGRAKSRTQVSPGRRGGGAQARRYPKRTQTTPQPREPRTRGPWSQAAHGQPQSSHRAAGEARSAHNAHPGGFRPPRGSASPTGSQHRGLRRKRLALVRLQVQPRSWGRASHLGLSAGRRPLSPAPGCRLLLQSVGGVLLKAAGLRARHAGSSSSRAPLALGGKAPSDYNSRHAAGGTGRRDLARAGWAETSHADWLHPLVRAWGRAWDNQWKGCVQGPVGSLSAPLQLGVLHPSRKVLATRNRLGQK